MSNLNLIQNKVILYYLKVITKSTLFISVLLIFTLLTLSTLGSLKASVFQFTKFSYFTFICLNVFFLVSSSYVISKKTEIRDFLERDSWKHIRRIFLSYIMIMSILCIFVIVIILIYKNNFTNSVFLLKGIIHFIIIYYSSNLLSISIGISIGYLIKSEMAIIVSLVVFGIFLGIPPILNPTNPLANLFNIYDDKIFFVTNDLAGLIFNTSYLLDKLFIFLFILVFFLIFRVLMRKGRGLINIGLLFIVFILQIMIIKDSEATEFHNNYTQTNQLDYEIISHNMDLELGVNLVNESTLILNSLKNTDSIELLLDSLFNIDKVTVNGESYKFNHKNNVLKVHGDFSAEKEITLNIAYKGNVNIVNELGFDTFYVSPISINLPGDSFLWYPTILGSNTSNVYYDINIQSFAKIFSNLSAIYEEGKYKLAGYASNLFIFAGQYKVEEVNGIEYIMPITYNQSLIESELQNAINLEGVAEEIKTTVSEKGYSKLIVGVWPFVNNTSFLKVEGDALLLRYKDY